MSKKNRNGDEGQPSADIEQVGTTGDASETAVDTESGLTTIKCRTKSKTEKDVIEKDGQTIEVPKTLEASFSYNPGKDLADAVALHGEAQVFNLYAAKHDIIRQDIGRRLLKEGKSESEIQAAQDAFKLGVITRSGKKGDWKAKAESAFDAMSPEEQIAYIEGLRAKAKAA